MKLSAVVPVYNEEKYLASTLESIAASAKRIEDFELIVVDNESTDGSRAIAGKYGARIVDEAEHNIGKVRNTGAKNAAGDVLVFVDADTLIPAELFAKIVDEMSDKQCVGGAVAIAYGDEMPRLTGYYVGFCKWMAQFTSMRHGATQFCRADIFAELGGYDTTIYVGEDIEFQTRLGRHAKSKGGHSAFIEEPKVITSSRRFVRFGLIKTMFFTHPLTVFLGWRIRSVWKSWYEDAIR